MEGRSDVSKRATAETAYQQAMAALRRIDELQGEINQLKRAVAQEELEYRVFPDGPQFKWEVHRVLDYYFPLSCKPPTLVGSGTCNTVAQCETQINTFLVNRFLNGKHITIEPIGASGRVTI